MIATLTDGRRSQCGGTLQQYPREYRRPRRGQEPNGGTAMRTLVILGSGTAGTIAANKLRRMLPRDEWDITIVEQQGTHYYQPAFLFIAFGKYKAQKAKTVSYTHLRAHETDSYLV